MYLAVNKKLEMIKLGEEGMSKDETGWKLGLLPQLAKLECKGKFLEGNWKCYSSEYTNDKKVEKVLVV